MIRLEWHLTFGTDNKGNGLVSAGDEYTITRLGPFGDAWTLLNSRGEELSRGSDILRLIDRAEQDVNGQ